MGMAAQSSVPLGHSERRGDSSLIGMIDIASLVFVWTYTTGQRWKFSNLLRCESLFLSLSFTTVITRQGSQQPIILFTNSLSQVSCYANHTRKTGHVWSGTFDLTGLAPSTLQRHHCK